MTLDQLAKVVLRDQVHCKMILKQLNFWVLPYLYRKSALDLLSRIVFVV